MIAMFIAVSGGALAWACSPGAPPRRFHFPPCSRWGQMHGHLPRLLSVEGLGPSLTPRGLLLTGIKLEDNKQTPNCQETRRRKSCTAEEHVYLSVHGFSSQPLGGEHDERVEVVGWVAPLVPHSGGGQGGGHLGGQGLAHGLGGQGVGHGGGLFGGGGHGGGHGGHGGHLGGGHFGGWHFSEHRCSSLFKQLGWHFVSHFCSHPGSHCLGSFLGSLGLFLSSLDIPS